MTHTGAPEINITEVRFVEPVRLPGGGHSTSARERAGLRMTYNTVTGALTLLVGKDSVMVPVTNVTYMVPAHDRRR